MNSELENLQNIAKHYEGKFFFSFKVVMLGFIKQNKLNKFFSKIIDNMADAVIVVDGQHNMIFCNESVQRTFGYYNNELIGENIKKLILGGISYEDEDLIEKFTREGIPAAFMGNKEDEEDSDKQEMGLRKDGGKFSLDIEVLDVSIGSTKYYATIIKDVSENRSKEKELLKLASTDPLTGAFNRREFKSLAEQEGIRSQRYNRPLSVMMLDIDHFKDLNDTYGHAAGDLGLQNFTASCSEALRNMDILGRWGGEEFVVILPETEIEGAIVIAERLRKVVEESSFISGTNKISFTVSIGVAQYKPEETTVDAPLARADEAIYNAKKQGRNRVCRAED